MKSKLIISLFFIASVLFVSAQITAEQRPNKFCVTGGILEGGGSLFGADIEAMLGETKLGVQAGGGLFGYGAGINVHFKPEIRSSFLSFQYWHQGIGASYAQSLCGPNIVYRAKKWFTAQIGLGFPIQKGPAWPDTVKQPEVMLMYAIGFYIPF